MTDDAHEDLWCDWPTPMREDWGPDFDEIELFWPRSPSQLNAKSDPTFWAAARDFLRSIGRSGNNSARKIKLIKNQAKLGAVWKTFLVASNLDPSPLVKKSSIVKLIEAYYVQLKLRYPIDYQLNTDQMREHLAGRERAGFLYELIAFCSLAPANKIKASKHRSITSMYFCRNCWDLACAYEPVFNPQSGRLISVRKSKNSYDYCRTCSSNTLARKASVRIPTAVKSLFGETFSNLDELADAIYLRLRAQQNNLLDARRRARIVATVLKSTCQKIKIFDRASLEKYLRSDSVLASVANISALAKKQFEISEQRQQKGKAFLNRESAELLLNIRSDLQEALEAVLTQQNCHD